MARYFIVNKPYGMLSQFTAEHGYTALGDLYKFPKDIYPVGRLDADSEGLLILTNDKNINTLLLRPNRKHKRSYCVQVEGNITNDAIKKLKAGVEITIDQQKYFTLEAAADRIGKPKNIVERNPPVRKDVASSWIKLTLIEGKNRQVRKMTAAVGYPTLRLIRMNIENLFLENLLPSGVKELDKSTIYNKLNILDL
jgi:23S rRNA pseudouridine2457 synthase